MQFEQAKALRDELEGDVKAANDALQSFPRGDNGLTPDAIKFSPEYRGAYAHYQGAFMRLQRFNSWFRMAFAGQLRAERRGKGPQQARN